MAARHDAGWPSGAQEATRHRAPAKKTLCPWTREPVSQYSNKLDSPPEPHSLLPRGKNTSDTGLLSGLGLFAGVDPDAALPAIACTGRLDLAPGQTLLSPDRPNRNVYVLLSGSMKVYLESTAAPALFTLGPGDCTGEMSIIEEKDPSAWVVAESDCHLMVIDQTILWELIDASHAFSRNLLRVLSERLRRDNEVIIDNADVLRQFERNAVTDALTDLHNRHWMQEMFRRKISRLQQSGARASLMMLDVDQFKRFNDRFGHIAGDHALCHVADVLREHFRPGDMIARYGGDEFAVLLPETTLQDALAIAERVRAAMHLILDGYAGDPADAAVTISAGVAEMLSHDTLESLLGNADAALYRAKLQGRNRVSE